MSGPTNDTPTDAFPRVKTPHRTFIPRTIRTLAVPIILGWVVLIAVLNVAVPQLEAVGKARAVSMSPAEAPSMMAMKQVGKNFNEGDSDSSVMVVLEGDKPLGDAAHEYYNQIVAKLLDDKDHV